MPVTSSCPTSTKINVPTIRRVIREPPPFTGPSLPKLGRKALAMRVPHDGLALADDEPEGCDERPDALCPVLGLAILGSS